MVSGLLAYVFFAATTRALGPEAASPVSVLWTYWSFSAAAFTFPVQHWVARSVAARHDENDVRSALPRLGLIVLATAMVTGVASWLVRDALFHRDGVAFPILVAGIAVGSGVMGFSRGTLSARGRFGSVASILVAENAVRCLGAVLLMLAHVTQPIGYAVALLVGHLVVVAWPSSLRVRWRAERASSSESPLQFLSAASAGQLLAQAVLTGGPVVLALGRGTAAEVTAMFAGLALFRAPFTFALGLVSQLTGVFTTWAVQNRGATLRRARDLIVVGSLGALVVAGVVGVTVGPDLVRIVFGPEIRLTATQTMLLAAGSSIALANLVLTVLVLALGRPGGVGRAWLTACFVAGVFFASTALTALDRTCWAFVVAQATAFVVLLVEEQARRSRLRSTAAPSRSTDM